MKIGIDARFFGPQENKGLGRYVEQLVENLEKIDCTNEYIIFLRKENWEAWHPKASNFKKVLADWPWYSLIEQIMVPIAIWRQKIDLMHFPHFNIPILCPVKFVVTIHDLILLQFPTERATTLGPFLYKIKYFGYRLVIKIGLWRAKKIIAVSECTKKELIQRLRVKSEKIAVIYGGYNKAPESELVHKEVLKKFNITKPYLLYVGNAYPHKNLEGLIKVFENLDFDCRLVLAGKEDYFYKRLKQEAAKSKVKNKIVFTGQISETELGVLYRNAALYIFPSFVEGFGLPGLEAMAHGLPVCASSSSCLPEIYGQAAIYFDPKNLKDMAEKIKKAFFDETLREKLIARGYEQAKKYSWQKCAEQTLAIYKAFKTVQ